MNDSVFKERYKHLNQEQKLAVDTIEGPVMVVAGPGTGKTTILTLRIANILRKTDTPAHGILAITYTDAGVKAMRQKLREVIGNRAHDVYIHTFHSFASAMIGEYPDHFVEMKDSRQMTDVEVEARIREILTHPGFAILRPLGRPDTYISGIVRAISDAKKEAITPSMIREYVLKESKALKNDESNISTRGATKGKLKAEALERLEKFEKTSLLADIYEQYEAEKRANKLRDYDDLIITILTTLQTDELFLRLVQERFLYILVDEHQDTNNSQNYILNLIAEFFETPNIFIVGDEKQAVYRFQGASVENFLLLRKRWKSMKTISLDTNYRSHQDILDASFAMIENNYGEGEYADLRVKLKSGNGDKKEPVHVIASENTNAMERYLAHEIQKITTKNPNATIAVITRRNRELERILQLLESNHIPVSSERSVDIFHHPIGVAFFHLLEYVSDPTRIDALSTTLALGMWGLSFAESIRVIRTLKSGDLDSLDTELPALSQIRARLLKGGAVGGIIDMAEYSGFTALSSRDPAFVHVWRGIVTLAQTLSRESDLDNPTELVKVMLAYRESAESKTVKVNLGAPDLPIKAMTAHGSKGLEFDYVFIPYANEETWIGRSHGSSFILPIAEANNHDIRDTRRLLYVAMTRARKHGVILYALEESDGRALTPLRFLSELDSKSIINKTLPREDVVLKKISADSKIGSENTDLLVHEAKSTLIKSGLSVTALNHFLECPSKFLYESILKLPQAPSVSSEKGSSMHEALARIWFGRLRSKEDIEKIIIAVVTEYIDSSFLSTKEKEAVKKELITDAPAVAAALAPHFALFGKVSAESWVETPYDTAHEGKQITISLHGKLDAIIDNGKEVQVFDYKTKQGMTPAAVKKNDNGNYFRQLAFYRLLVENDFRFRNKSVSTSLVFVSPDDKGRCPTVTISATDSDIVNLKEEIKTLVDSVWSGRVATEYCTDRLCKYCGYKRLLN